MITPKGKLALQYIEKFFPEKIFNSAELNEKIEEKISPVTLTYLAKNNILIRFDTNPITYQLKTDYQINFEKKVMPKTTKSNNDNLHKALKNKNDEFYTKYEDIKKECSLYSSFYKDKIIYLISDNKNSQFLQFFIDNYELYGIKKIIATSYNEHSYGEKIEYFNSQFNITNLQGNGDFRSDECISLLKECDIVITNPPFSLFRELVILITNYNKKFLLVGNENTFASTEIFPMFKEGLISTGYNRIKEFFQPDGSIQKFGNTLWFTNLVVNKEESFLPLVENYTPEKYPQYDNYEAINIDKISLIPKDYYGVMGVPISYLAKHNSKQFILLGLAAGNSKKHKLYYTVPYNPSPLDRGGCGVVNEIRKYSRVFIQRKE